MPETQGAPILTVSGQRVALGPLRRDLLPQYQRWINDLIAAQNLGMIPRPVTQEAESSWYDRMVAGNDIVFTMDERATWRPIGKPGFTRLNTATGRQNSAS